MSFYFYNLFISYTMNSENTISTNTQIAINATVLLASDMGSIFSIINTADYDSKIYTEVKTTYEKMIKIAYESEKGLLNLLRIIKVSEDIKKLSHLIIKMKALNPLISDDLIDNLTTTVTNANQAVALTIIALKKD
jgi:hypothetical protein